MAASETVQGRADHRQRRGAYSPQSHSRGGKLSLTGLCISRTSSFRWPATVKKQHQRREGEHLWRSLDNAPSLRYEADSLNYRRDEAPHPRSRSPVNDSGGRAPWPCRIRGAALEAVSTCCCCLPTALLQRLSFPHCPPEPTHRLPIDPPLPLRKAREEWGFPTWARRGGRRAPARRLGDMLANNEPVASHHPSHHERTERDPHQAPPCFLFQSIAIRLLRCCLLLFPHHDKSS